MAALVMPAALGGRGDCNNDGGIDAGDISAVILEIFDSDGNLASDVPGGTFPGDCEGCDANADAYVDAGDVSCIILLIFGGPGACGPTVPPTAARTPTSSATSSPTLAASLTPPASTTPSPTLTASATPSSTPTASATPYVAPDTIAGVQIEDGNLIPAQVSRMVEAGLRYVRTRILWAYIEPYDRAPPQYWWSMLDDHLGGLVSSGLTPIGVIYNHPSWASSKSCGPIDRAPLSRYGDFVRALVERYDGDGVHDAPASPRVAYWEIGNEEDFNVAYAAGEADYGSCFGGQPAAYGAYLRVAYLAAKDADPTTTVVFGGPAYDRFYNKSGYSPTGPFNYTFVRSTLDWLYTSHGTEPDWPFFDWMAIHVYNDYRNNWDGTQPYDQEVLGKVKHLRDYQMVHPGWYDLRAKPMALTESTLASMPTDRWTERSEGIQAAYPGQLMLRSMAGGLSVAIWYILEDYTTGNCGSLYDWMGYGLLRSLGVYNAALRCGAANPIPGYEVADDHEPKLAHTAYSVAISQLAGASYVTQLTYAQTGSTSIEAYRFTRPDGVSMIGAFTDTGERLGRKGYSPLEVPMTFRPAILPGWTGRLAVVDCLGNTTFYEGSSITLTITQWPIYVRPD